MTKPMGIRQVLIHLNKVVLGAEKPETVPNLWPEIEKGFSTSEKEILFWVLQRAVYKNMRVFTRNISLEHREVFEHLTNVLNQHIEYVVYHSPAPYPFHGHSPWINGENPLRLSHKIKFFGARRCALGLPALRLLKGLEKGQPLRVDPKHFLIKNDVIHPR